MTELQDIFADALPTTVFIYGSAVCLLVSVLAALWLQLGAESIKAVIRPTLRRGPTFAKP